MKYTALAALLMAAVLLLASCAPPASDPAAPPAAPMEQTGADTAQPTEEGEAEFPAYYGDWTVTGEFTAGRISALSPEEIEAMTGLTVSYAAAVFRAPGEEAVENPAYTEGVTTGETLAADYGVSAADLGLPEGEAATISVDNAWGLGSFAVVKDAETMLLYLDGVWFTAVREA